MTSMRTLPASQVPENTGNYGKGGNRRQKPGEPRVNANDPPHFTLPKGAHSRANCGFPPALKANDPTTLSQFMRHALLGPMLQANGKMPAPIPTQGPDAPDAFMLTEIQAQAGRSLIPPSALPDKLFIDYLQALAPSALRSTDTSPMPPIGPRHIALMLGGLPLTGLDDAAARAIHLLNIPLPDDHPRSLSAAMSVIGYGENSTHGHYDTWDAAQLDRRPGESEEMHYNRITTLYTTPPAKEKTAAAGMLSQRKQFLTEQIRGPFCHKVPVTDCYQADLYHRIAALKPQVMARAYRLLSKDSHEMTPLARKLLLDAHGPAHLDLHCRPSNTTFHTAVRMVFEQAWVELDLVGDPEIDMPRLLARLLIGGLARGGQARLAAPPRINAQTLLGLSLLTGVPTPTLVRFAADDLRRRGETFITPDTVREVVRLVDESEMFHLASPGWMDEMASMAAEMDYATTAPRAAFATKLRNGAYPLFSVNGDYHLLKVRNEGEDNEQRVYRPAKDRRIDHLYDES